MLAYEPHIQKCFQFGHDYRISGDHTHKYSKLVKAANHNGNAFTASRITLSLLDKITISHLTFTKSNFEIERIRIATKAGDLQRCETDNINEDAVPQENYFPTLTQGTIKVLKKSNSASSLPNATMTDNEYSYFRERNALDGWCIVVSNKLSCADEVICTGLHCEWSMHDDTQSITRLLRISFQNEKADVKILSLIKAFD